MNYIKVKYRQSKKSGKIKARIRKYSSLFLVVIILFSTYSSSFAEDSVDFSGSIKEVSVLKNVGSGWQSATELTDGDKVIVDIKYEFDFKNLPEGTSKIHYRLPTGIRVSKEQDGIVHSIVGSSGNYENAGNYKIDTDGMIEISFNKDFIEKNTGIDGEIKFNGIASSEGLENGGKINFSGKGPDISIVKPPSPPQEDKYDIKTEKTGKLSDDRTSINYTIEMSTKNGTEENLTVEDHIDKWNSNNVTYTQKRDISIKKIHADNSSSFVNKGEYTLKWLSDEDGFEITNLPRLGKGEKYQVNYSVSVLPKDPNSELYQIYNTVYSKSGGDGGVNRIEWHKKNIDKKGNYDPNTGLILWTIKINPDGKDITNWTFEDRVFGEIHGPVYLRRGYGNDVDISKYLTKYQDGSLLQYQFSNLTSDEEKDQSIQFIFMLNLLKNRKNQE